MDCSRPTAVFLLLHATALRTRQPCCIPLVSPFLKPKRKNARVAAEMRGEADSFGQNVSEAGRQTCHDPPDGAQNRKALNFNMKPPDRLLRAFSAWRYQGPKKVARSIQAPSGRDMIVSSSVIIDFQKGALERIRPEIPFFSSHFRPWQT